jgi:hypothetical protein
MVRQQSVGAVIVVTIIALVVGYLLTDLVRHKTGHAAGHISVECPHRKHVWVQIELEQPLWWCENCKTLHWTASTLARH